MALEKLRKGARIGSRKFGEPTVGTVLGVSRGSAFVQWAGSFVEDELSIDLDDIEVISEAEFEPEMRKAVAEAKRRSQRLGWKWKED